MQDFTCLQGLVDSGKLLLENRVLYDNYQPVRTGIIWYFWHMASLRFLKSERLSGKKRWELLFSEGKQLKAFPLRLYYLQGKASDSAGFRAGFAVPKRSVKKATDRNRIKRYLREAYRTQKPGFFNNTEGSYALVFLYLGKKLPEYHQIEKAVHQLLQKFCLNEKIHQN